MEITGSGKDMTAYQRVFWNWVQLIQPLIIQLGLVSNCTLCSLRSSECTLMPNLIDWYTVRGFLEVWCKHWKAFYTSAVEKLLVSRRKTRLKNVSEDEQYDQHLLNYLLNDDSDNDDHDDYKDSPVRMVDGCCLCYTGLPFDKHKHSIVYYGLI